eukprot:SAG11_NODE_5489_length_1547_cov_1.098066_2_plen_304_part_00
MARIICGKDANDGLSEATPWQSLERANHTALQPGESLLLRRGDVWRGEMLMLSVRGFVGKVITIASFGDTAAARPLIEGVNKSTSITCILNAASFVVVDGLAFSTAKVGLYVRYWDSYGHEGISITDCLFSNIDDPEFDPYTMATQGRFMERDISWSSGIMVGGQLFSTAEPGIVLTGLNVSNSTFAHCAVGLQVAVGDWNSPPGGAANPPPFSRVQKLLVSDITQTGALQGIVALNFVSDAPAEASASTCPPARQAAFYGLAATWSLTTRASANWRFGHEQRVGPTPDGEGIDFEGGNRLQA